jgi:ribA/ribD-fused uncharacterized protein
MATIETVSSVEELVELAASGERVKYVHFWGHQPQRDGSVGAGCFSQWWPSAFTVDGVEFATAEHFMMWRKAMLFDDADAAQRVLGVEHPSEAKAVGRTVRGFDDATWVEHRFDIVTDANVAKFSQHADLGAYLLGTGDRVLVEASPRDRIWGIGMGAGNEHASSPDRWRGLNLLGFALMRARDILRAAPAAGAS